MQNLFPGIPSFMEDRLNGRPGHTWFAPAPPRRNHGRVCTQLPAGMPDCLLVEILRFEEGTERCTAAVYGEHAYVIHYAFTPHA